MHAIADTIENVQTLEDLLSAPTEPTIELMRNLEGDLLFLGAAGKIGPSLARMARRASDLAGKKRRIIAVSRFSAVDEQARFEAHGIETLRCDLLDEAAVKRLPNAENVIFLAGLKFGSSTRRADTWAMNTYLPGLVCQKFRSSRIVAYSTGAVYGLASLASGGSREVDTPEPIGEYAMSCLGRERMFEYFGCTLNIPIALIRLFYACELRYGVVVDMARKIMADDPIDVTMGQFNIIWQGDNNAMTLLALEHASSPPLVLNVTGPEQLGIRETAEAIGERLGREPRFVGCEAGTACLGNSMKAIQLFGPPRVSAEQVIGWAADWVRRDGEYLGKPTHFEVVNGKY